jgi:hypothetical protein
VVSYPVVRARIEWEALAEVLGDAALTTAGRPFDFGASDVQFRGRIGP